MNQFRVGLLIEALKVLNDTTDYDERKLLREALVNEFGLLPSKEDNTTRLNVLEEEFDRVCDEKANLKEAIRLISESF